MTAVVTPSGALRSAWLPVLALLGNAAIWGMSWWPFRRMHEAGLHPLWATAWMYAVMCAAVVLLRPAWLRAVLANRALWWLALCAGLTNAAFNWAVTVGDVVRVVLLFYLMPAWAVLLSWRLLGERPGMAGLLRLVLAFAGVVLVVLPPQASWAALVQGLSLADALAVFGGFMFALNNVQLRRLHAVAGSTRMLAMFLGAMVVGGLGATLAAALGLVPPMLSVPVRWGEAGSVGLALGLALMVGNWGLQYGAARLPAGTTSVVLLSEVVFASASAIALGAAVLHGRTLAGGALIVLVALLAAWRR